MSIKSQYEAVDLHTPEVSAWPAEIPELTEEEAVKATKRLWRFAMGETLHLPIVITSGNRYTWTARSRVGDPELRVNPGRGWRHLVHDLSHLFNRRANGWQERPHSKFHARLEAKLIKQVVLRGWLDGRLKTQAKPEPEQADPRGVKLQRIEARMANWERKRARAEKALAKLARQQRYYQRVLD